MPVVNFSRQANNGVCMLIGPAWLLFFTQTLYIEWLPGNDGSAQRRCKKGSSDGMASAHQPMAVRDKLRFLINYQILIKTSTAWIRSASPHVLDSASESGLKKSSRAPVHVSFRSMGVMIITGSLQSSHASFDVGIGRGT